MAGAPRYDTLRSQPCLSSLAALLIVGSARLQRRKDRNAKITKCALTTRTESSAFCEAERMVTAAAGDLKKIEERTYANCVCVCSAKQKKFIDKSSGSHGSLRSVARSSLVALAGKKTKNSLRRSFLVSSKTCR